MLLQYLEVTYFKIQTDHDSLERRFNLGVAVARLACWQLRRSKFDLAVVHCAEIKHHGADARFRVTATGKEKKPIEDDLQVIIPEPQTGGAPNMHLFSDKTTTLNDASIRAVF